MKKKKKVLQIYFLCFLLIMIIGFTYNKKEQTKIYVSNEELDLLAATDTTIIRACSGSSSAQTKEILAGKTAWTGDNILVGTMISHDSEVITLNAGDVYTIPEGYHDGKGRIIINNLENQTSADATAKDVLIGETVWVNGKQIVGTLKKQSFDNIALNPGDSYTIPEGYYENPITISTPSLSELTNATLTADTLSAGKTAWANGQKIIGTGKENQISYQEGQKANTSNGTTRLTAITTRMNIKLGSLGDSLQGTGANMILDGTGVNGVGYIGVYQTASLIASSNYQTISATIPNRKCD